MGIIICEDRDAVLYVGGKQVYENPISVLLFALDRAGRSRSRTSLVFGGIRSGEAGYPQRHCHESGVDQSSCALSWRRERQQRQDRRLGDRIDEPGRINATGLDPEFAEGRRNCDGYRFQRERRIESGKRDNRDAKRRKESLRRVFGGRKSVTL